MGEPDSQSLGCFFLTYEIKDFWKNTKIIIVIYLLTPGLRERIFQATTNIVTCIWLLRYVKFLIVCVNNIKLISSFVEPRQTL